MQVMSLPSGITRGGEGASSSSASRRSVVRTQESTNSMGVHRTSVLAPAAAQHAAPPISSRSSGTSATRCAALYFLSQQFAGQQTLVHASKSSWCHGEEKQARECPGLEACPGKHHCEDCVWGKWGPWEPEECPCNGLQERHREISQHNNFCGQACEGVKTETRSCGTPECVPVPKDCVFGEWSPWSQCDSLCDGGVEKRERVIFSEAANGGKQCVGDTVEMRPCNTFPCHPKIDCKLTDWTPWSECSGSCGGGQQERTRKVEVPPLYNGHVCEGDLVEIKGCSEQPCAEGTNCEWHEWEKWSSCSATCGGGEQMRSRLVKTAPRGAGALCDPKDMTELQPCNQQACHKPVDCEMNDWSKWGSCSATCNGIRERDRVVKRYPAHNGKACEGVLREVEACNIEQCHKDDFVPKEPIECLIGSWGNWTECSVTCGGGYREKQRKVVQTPLHGGEGCRGPLKMIEPCKTEKCKPTHVVLPLDCSWSEWDDWGGCSASCGVGEKSRQRQVVTMPNSIGKPCDARDSQEVTSCNPEPCDATDCVWAQWSGWGACTCTGLEERHRVIQKHAMNGGKPCDGAKIETKACHPDCEHPPQDCLLSDWSSWGSCTATCGGGQTIRSRKILQGAKFGGKPCEGELKELTECNQKHCPDEPQPADCKISEWTKWSACSAECGGGQRYRHREIIAQAVHGGQACGSELSLAEVGSCNEKECLTPQDCKWGAWAAWGDCSSSCGGGEKERTRTILKAPRYGGKLCEAKVTQEVKKCNTQECPGALHCVDAKWSEWSEFSLCSASCGDGFRYRTREVAVAANSCGRPIQGLRQEFEECNRGPCDHHVKDCAFSNWESWGDCSCPCNGIKERTRRIKTYPDNGGEGCEGSLKQIAACNEKVCPQWQPVDCKVGPWTKWTGCSSKCGGGFKTRKREIIAHPRNGGKPCNADLEEVTACNEQQCDTAIDCEMGEWDDWGSCSHACGGGEQMRYRAVTTMPKRGGKPCAKSETSEMRECNTQECGSVAYCGWTDWAPWSNCSATCGVGEQWRRRHLQITQHLGKDEEVIATSIMDALLHTRFAGEHMMFTFFLGIFTSLVVLSVTHRLVRERSRAGAGSGSTVEYERTGETEMMEAGGGSGFEDAGAYVE